MHSKMLQGKNKKISFYLFFLLYQWTQNSCLTDKKCHTAANKFFFLPWRRARCESWWSAHDCPLEGSHRILTKGKIHHQNIESNGQEAESSSASAIHFRKISHLWLCWLQPHGPQLHSPSEDSGKLGPGRSLWSLGPLLSGATFRQKSINLHLLRKHVRQFPVCSSKKVTGRYWEVLMWLKVHIVILGANNLTQNSQHW